MSKTKKILICILCISSFASLHADIEKTSSLFYAKLDASRPPGESIILPSLGLGARFQWDYIGWDLSANFASKRSIDYTSLKGLILFYPAPWKIHQFYLGIGQGVRFYEYVGLIEAYRIFPHGIFANDATIINLEGVLGYEFRHKRHLKTFIQLEPSQPLSISQGVKCNYGYSPGVALTAGVGF